ncbi:25973_t:CDS:2 [Dentiscutata erythropus]|uniref:25973_t:CDS:1 n=1 Tax=Dentiscutata erythropus TaxID=1348616 RepID=A0A9N9ALE3_9GLOM|nr:25973_t:CDS:2 [Dentiscutata erythropus]
MTKVIVKNISATASEKTGLLKIILSLSKETFVTTCDGTQDGDGIRQEDKVRNDKEPIVKPKSAIFAEILAAGYQLQDTIIEKGLEFDAKYGISARLSSYLSTIQEQLLSLENKYHVYETVSSKATELDSKYEVQNKVKSAASQVQDKATQALDTYPGKQLYEFYSNTSKQVIDVHTEARRIANEKKAAQIVDASHASQQQEKVETQ